MKILGYILISLSIILGLVSYNMDTTVESSNLDEYSEIPVRVHNIGLMQQRQNLLILSSVLFIGGILLVVFSKKETTPTLSQRYLDTWELAKMAEFRGNTEEAIRLYFDTLYYLENDFDEDNLERPVQLARAMNMKEIKSKIDELKNLS
jgi:hypothetical protein